MYNLANFIHFFSFSLGLTAIYIAVSLRRRSRFQPIRSYTRFLIGMNVVIFLIHFSEPLLRAIFTDEGYEKNLDTFYRYSIVIYGAIRLYMSVIFLSFTHQLIKRKLPLAYGYVAAAWILVVGVLLFGFNMPEAIQHRLEGTVILSVHLILALALIFGSVLVLRQDEKVERIDPRMLKPFFLCFIVYALLGVVLRIANLFDDRIQEYILMLGVGLLSLTFNFLNVLFLRRVFQMPKPVIQFTDNQLIDEYGITCREQEIIRLICEGKTNKEIAEILFISPITVRDHTSNIFRKTGVRSRTQLAGLLIERPTG